MVDMRTFFQSFSLINRIIVYCLVNANTYARIGTHLSPCSYKLLYMVNIKMTISQHVPTEWWYEPNKIVITAIVSQVTEIPITPATPTRWDDYVASFPNWEQLLLQHVTFVDQAQLLVILRTAMLLLLTSDGDTHALQGSFGCYWTVGGVPTGWTPDLSAPKATEC
jgi:hypothetical protein